MQVVKGGKWAGGGPATSWGPLPWVVLGSRSLLGWPKAPHAGIETAQPGSVVTWFFLYLLGWVKKTQGLWESEGRLRVVPRGLPAGSTSTLSKVRDHREWKSELESGEASVLGR